MKKSFNLRYNEKIIRGKKVWSHEYPETWEFLPDTFCPNCGHKGVWAGDGYDYYVENEHVCLECKFAFHLPNSGEIDENSPIWRQRIESLGAYPPPLRSHKLEIKEYGYSIAVKNGRIDDIKKIGG